MSWLADVSQFLTPIGVLATAWVSWDNKRILRKQNLEQARLASNVEKIEIATNSMKDELVKATARASRAEGLAEGRESVERSNRS